MRFVPLFVLLLLLVPLMAQAQQSDPVQRAQSLVEQALTGDAASVYDLFTDQIKAQVHRRISSTAAMTGVSAAVR